MRISSRRAFIRNNTETPVLFSYYNTSQYYHGVMRNNGMGGMYFETTQKLFPGTDIYIKILDFQPDPYWPEYTDAYRGEVVWAQPVSNGDGKVKYGVGIRFMVNCCDQCGEYMPYNAIEKTEEHIILCKDCASQLSLLTGTMKTSIEHYLAGNVI